MASAQARRHLPDEVADRIQDRILGGEFSPGDRLPPERELAEQLGVNRSSVREGLRKLEQLRLVEIQHGSGIRVCSPSEASLDLAWKLMWQQGKPNLPWIRDGLELRDALLPGLTRLMLEHASEAERRELAQALRTGIDPALSEEELVSRLREVQAEVARITGNQVVILLQHALGRFLMRPEMQPFRTGVLALRKELHEVLSALADSIECGETPQAERQTRELSRLLSRSLLETLERVSAPE